MFDSVVIGVDGLSGGEDAIALATELASPNAAMTFAYVYGTGGMFGRGGALGVSGDLQLGEEILAEERESGGIPAELTPVMAASVSRGLHELATSRSADLVVIGSCHRGRVGRVLVGNDALATLHGAPCAVAIASAGFAEKVDEIRRIGVGDDGSAEAALARAAALELGERLGASVRARSVVSLQALPQSQADPVEWPAATERLLREERARLDAIEGLEGDVVYGDPSDELLALSSDVDLVIVGSRGFGAVGRLMNGSTSEYLVHRAHCPILVMPRPSDQVSATAPPDQEAAG